MNQILVTEKVIVTKEMRKKKKFYKRNFFLSVFLICVLFSYYVYAEYDRNKYEQKSQDILEQINIEEVIQANTEEDNTTMDETTFVASNAIRIEDDILKVFLGGSSETAEEVKLGNILKDVKHTVEENQTNNETVVNDNEDYNIDDTNTEQQEQYTTSDGNVNYSAESIVRIPRLGIEYPVLSETNDELLKISVNKLWGPKPNEVGNYVIVGHNYKSGKMFGKLKNIKIGDIIELTDLTGRTIKYVVSETYIIEPTNTKCTSQLTNGKKKITLITCANSGEYPNIMNIGTKIGAKIYHFAVPLVIKKFTNVVIRIIPIIIGTPESPALFKKLAPVTAITVPRFV